MTDLVQQSMKAMDLGFSSNVFTEQPQQPKAEPTPVVSDLVVVEILTDTKPE
jgi:hypothetical protein